MPRVLGKAIFPGLLVCGLFFTVAAEEPKRPEHEVQLEEDEAVEVLLRKARESAAKGAEDAEAWPVCVKAYTEILNKHANKVFLSRWSGDGGEDARAYGLGVYRSVAEKVTEEIAKLPPAGLAVYRALIDPQARNVYAAAAEQLDERQMETVAQTFFSSAWGDDALVWLAEYAYQRGADRQVLNRLGRLSVHPDPDVSKLAVAVRAFLAEVRLGQREAAEKSLKSLEQLAASEGLEKLRIGQKSGEAALEDLRARLKTLGTVEKAEARVEGWDTYFGDATHTRSAPERSAVGVRKWSIPIPRLLGAAEGHVASVSTLVRDFRTGQTKRVTPMNIHLALRKGLFMLTNGRVVACHSISRPEPDRPVFWWPPSARDLWPSLPKPEQQANQPFYGQQMGVVDQVFFPTLGEEHLYVALGPPPLAPMPQWWGGRDRPRQEPNWLVAVGKKAGGKLGLEGGSLLWSLEPGGDEACRINGKAEQEWLRGAYLVSSPTHADGVLYTMAVEESNGPRTAWVVAFDAASGRLLWRTRICAGQPPQYGGGLQPALGLPVAVSGGLVFCVTNLGAAAAVEAATGAIRWIRVYDRTPGLVIDPRTGQYPVSSYWAANAPMVFGDLLICTPQDSNFIYGFDLQTGRRRWQAERVRSLGRGGATEQLEYVIGLLHGRLVLSGRSLVFMDAKGGKIEYSPEWQNDSIVGRGAVAGEYVFVPTTRGIVIIDGRLGSSGKPMWKMVGGENEYRWIEPKEEAGHLFVDRDALLSVSATHVNAYFVSEVIEARLKKRIEEAADDLAAWLELGDLYHVQDRFEDAVKTFDLALARPSAQKDDDETRRLVGELRMRKFESFLGAGEKGLAAKKGAEGYAYYEKALACAPSVQATVRALWKLGDAALAQGDPGAAAGHFQTLLSEHGDVHFSFEAHSSCLASVYARRRLEQIRKEHPGALAPLEAQAREAIRKAIAGRDASVLEATLRRHPNSEAYADGLLALIKLALEKGDPLTARVQGMRFLSSCRQSSRLPDALACLAISNEKTGLLGAAKQTLRRLATMKGSVEPPGEPAQGAAEWAAARLQKPEYAQPVSNAAKDLGNGRLVEMWSREDSSATGVLVPGGPTPPSMLDQVLVLHRNNAELSSRSGRSGEELWLPRPKLPAGFQPQWSAWSQELLVVAGQNELKAYDARSFGKVAWSYTFAGGEETVLTDEEALQVMHQRGQVGLSVNEQLVALSLPNGSLVVLDAASGQPFWTAKGQGRPWLGAPALGNDFVAVATMHQQPMKVIVYDFLTGQQRFEIQPPGNQLVHPPQAQGDGLYLLCADGRLHVYGGEDGKQVWEHPFEAPAVHMQVNADLFIAVLANQQAVALNVEREAGEKRLLWRTVPEGSGHCNGVVVDGAEVFVSQRFEGQQGRVSAYHAGGGKLRYRVDTAGVPIDAKEDLARGHLLVVTPDPRSGGSQCLSLVDRRTGKLTWSQPMPPRASSAVFDGGVLVAGAGKLTGYVVAESESVGADLEAMRKAFAEKPGDLTLALRLAQVLHERKESREALDVLARYLASPGVSEEGFSQAYDRLRRLRANLARTDKPVVRFERVARPLTLDGAPADWQALAALKLETWPSVHLVRDEEQRFAYPRDAWRGPDDLSVAFRGGYDENNLYLHFDVADDRASSAEQQDAELFRGDSVQVAFDLEREDGLGFQGQDFEMGWGIGAQGTLLSWRWVEGGKYLMKPMETPVRATRDEARKRTEYRAILPLAYLGLKPAAGTAFGFSFVVNDRDDEKGVRKGIAVSPGIWNPKFPGQYATGELK